MGRMAATIVHDLKSPIAIMFGFAELMSSATEQERAEYFQYISDETSRLVDMVEGFVPIIRLGMEG